MRIQRYLVAAIVAVAACWTCGSVSAQEMQAAPEPEEIEVDSSDSMADTSFLYRTPDEYRTDILAAINDAQTDALVCQQIVQEARERGENLSDDDFLKYLDTPDVRMERQARIDYWRQERKKIKESGMQLDYRKYAIGLGMIVVVLLLIVFCSGKRNPKIEETESKKE